jgi:hypothetical protein
VLCNLRGDERSGEQPRAVNFQSGSNVPPGENPRAARRVAAHGHEGFQRRRGQALKCQPRDDERRRRRRRGLTSASA